MKGNGLDALAALCGATGRAQTETEVAAPASADGNGAQVVAGLSASGTPALQPGTAPPSVPLNVNPQLQLQQVTGFGNAANPFSAAASMAAIMQAAQQPTLGDPASITAMQQLAYYQYIQFAAQAAAMQAQAQAVTGNGNLTQQQHQQQQQAIPFDGTKSAVPFNFASAASQLPQKLDLHDTFSKMTNQQFNQPPVSEVSPAVTPPGGNTMQPPPPTPPSQVLSSQNGRMISNPTVPRPNPPASGTTVMLKSPQTAIAQRPKADTTLSAELSPFEGGDKKQLKRAANRRSAQLSRKRKKQFIEELMEENDELRRKEQILVSIPDLIVVFDSSGKLWFVSHSVSRFLDFSPRELEGSSFWDRLCDDSVRLLKAAFMDALAARKTDTDTTPLGSGVWEFRLVDKDGSQKVITLNGVVHFTGESPECVCSIRPREERVESAAALPTHRNVSITSGSSNGMQLIRPTIKPQQSVISSLSSDDASQIARVKAPRRRSAQISDVGSICSESGSDSYNSTYA